MPAHLDWITATSHVAVARRRGRVLALICQAAPVARGPREG